MSSPFYYDNSEAVDANGYVQVDRIYCLKLDQFTDADWALLADCYGRLPGWSGTGEHGFPCWFGSSESAPYLIASAEPSGLQVFGAVQPNDLRRWHDAFFDVCSKLPHSED